MSTKHLGLIVSIGLLVFVTPVAEAQRRKAPKEVERDVRKAVKDYDKAIRKEVKDANKKDSAVRQPGSHGPPPGKGWRKDDFRVEGVRPADLGVAFANRGTGLVIDQVSPRGSLAAYGFRDGDRILSVDGHRIGREKEFFQYLFAEDVRWGDVTVVVLRGDRERELLVSPAALIHELHPVREDPLHRLGVTLGDRAGNDLRVVEVLPQSAAEAAGIRRGDEIYKFDNVSVRSANALRRVVDQLDAGAYYVHVERDASTRKLAIEIPD
jgi:S1-C subfamily serine protease